MWRGLSGSAAAHSIGMSGDAPPSPRNHLIIALIYLIQRAGLRPYALQGDLARPRCWTTDQVAVCPWGVPPSADESGVAVGRGDGRRRSVHATR